MNSRTSTGDPGDETAGGNGEDAVGDSGDETAGVTGEGTAGPTPRPADHPLPPGPDGYPVVGSALRFFRDPFDFYDSLGAYGDVVRWHIPGVAYTSLLHPDHVRRVLVEDHERFGRGPVENLGFDFAPDGLLLSEGEQWRRQRRLVQPAFSMDRIRSYADAMVEGAERTAATWTDGGEVALNRAFAGLALRVLARALFDADVAPDGDDAVVARAARAINQRARVSNLAAFVPDWVPTPTNRRYRRALADYRAHADELIARRREAGADGDDLLSILLAAEGPAGDGLSAAEVRDNLLTFLFAGHETTALGLTYTFLLLADHGDAARRLRGELDAELGDRRPTFGDVPGLSYTEQVVKEALRLHPPVHFLLRQAEEDCVVGGYRVPEGTLVTMPQFFIHRDERFYDAPEAFDPGRWAGEGSDPGEGDGGEGGAETAEAPRDDRPEYAYFPFGGGPRHCIGMRFAMLELKLVVAVLARRFEFELLSDPDPAVSTGLTHRPKEDVRVRVYRR